LKAHQLQSVQHFIAVAFCPANRSAATHTGSADDHKSFDARVAQYLAIGPQPGQNNHPESSNPAFALSVTAAFAIFQFDQPGDPLSFGNARAAALEHFPQGRFRLWWPGGPSRSRSWHR
jgi:hypothetical protein